MSGLDELKAAYEEIRDTYAYYCNGVTLPDEDAEFWGFIFIYAGFPIKTWIIYQLYDAPFPENDKIIFLGDDEGEASFSASAFFAIANLVKAFQANRSDRETMDAFIEYLKKDIHAKE